VQLAGSLGNAAQFHNLYDIGESNPVPAYGLLSILGSQVNQFVTQHFIQIHARVLEVILLTDRQTDKQTRAKTFTSSFVKATSPPSA